MDKMKTSIISFTLGIVLAGPVAAYATEPAPGSASSNQASDLWGRIALRAVVDLDASGERDPSNFYRLKSFEPL